MKLFTVVFFTASIIPLHALLAQDATTVPIPGGSTAPSTQPTPAPLFPSGTPPPIVNKPTHSGGGAEQGSALDNPLLKVGKSSASDEDIADNVAYRKAKTKALRDEKVAQALAEADAAKTDPDKRAALKRYYTLLADRILKIDGSIKKLVETRLKNSLKELDQSKVRPEEYSQQASAAH